VCTAPPTLVSALKDIMKTHSGHGQVQLSSTQHSHGSPSNMNIHDAAKVSRIQDIQGSKAALIHGSTNYTCMHENGRTQAGLYTYIHIYIYIYIYVCIHIYMYTYIPYVRTSTQGTARTHAT